MTSLDWHKVPWAPVRRGMKEEPSRPVGIKLVNVSENYVSGNSSNGSVNLSSPRSDRICNESLRSWIEHQEDCVIQLHIVWVVASLRTDLWIRRELSRMHSDDQCSHSHLAFDNSNDSSYIVRIVNGGFLWPPKRCMEGHYVLPMRFLSFLEHRPRIGHRMEPNQTVTCSEVRQIWKPPFPPIDNIWAMMIVWR